ncbi:aspartyl protease family protein [Bradyrhizobium sp.]|uniref:retroviral-like aspartic protease family protein n=1 Tax=Bradyrhizobium sp. TaxID=376 RepID=UPI0027281C15|nr:aspartyl protease family protein [Bradyrhizobium sp.]MDO9298064.1 aspartyl protease family protein [Bradyrhizobium sp.]
MSNIKEPFVDFHPDRNFRPHVEERSRFLPILFGVLALLAACGYGGYYFYENSESFNPYKKVYDRLGIELPRTFEKFGRAAQHLEQLRREPCDRVAFSAFATLVESAGYPRESAKSLESYNRECTQSDEMLEAAYAAYTRVGDHKAALRVADELVKSDSGNKTYRFWRGNAHERAKDYKAALADYISTLELFSNLSNVASSQFYQVSLMYDKIGKPCEAISPLETYLSYNVKERQTQQIAKLISEYSRKGKCAATYANGSARIVIPPSNRIDVTINGARARMILDTGATQVSITPEMAARARIVPDTSDLVEVKVVGGLMQQASGYAQSIQVGSATAANVPILITIGSKDAFGPETDGLLGMSFLSRFTMTLSTGLVELQQKVRN